MELIRENVYVVDTTQSLRSFLTAACAFFNRVSIDDFAANAQSTANSLTLSAALSAATLALNLVEMRAADIASAVLAGLNILISFGTMTNIARYKIRNEEARIDFFNRVLPGIERVVFSLTSKFNKQATPLEANPYFAGFESVVSVVQDQMQYYNIKNKELFNQAYAHVRNSNFELNA